MQPWLKLSLKRMSVMLVKIYKKHSRELYVEDKMQGLPAVTQLSDSCISSQ